jgi:uncharacterized membrane protein YbhN (UPF0104 family)
MRRAATDNDRTPAWLRWTTRISLVLGLIALAITVGAVGVDTLVGHLEAIGPWFLLLLAIEAASTFCDAGAIYWMTRGRGAPAFRKVCVAQFAGRAVNSVTPGANLGEALKVSLLARECSPQRIIAGVMYVAICAVVVSLSIVALGSLITAIVFPVPAAAMIALIVGAIVSSAIAISLVVLVRRGMLGSLARSARRLRLISAARLATWTAQLADLDARLRGDVQGEHRVGASCLILVSQVLSRGAVWATILASGYSLGGPQLIAILSAGVILGWVCNIVPMGIGVSEGGNLALFTLIGAPPSLGVALALAKRVNQIVFAGLGFGVLAVDRLATHVDEAVIPLSTMATSTARHAIISS